MTPNQQTFKALLCQCLTSRDGDWAAVDRYLQIEPDLLWSATDGYWSALSIAAHCGGDQGLPIIQRLLASGVPPDFHPGEQGIKPLLSAAQSNNEAAMRLLLNYGANPDSRLENGLTALHIPLLNMANEEKTANINKCASTLKLLLNKGADPNLPDTNQNTPLHFAYGRIFVFNHFLEKARQNELRFQKVRPPLKDKHGQVITPEPVLVHERCIEAMAEIIDLLLVNGADTTLLNIYGRTPEQCAVQGLGLDKDDSLWTWRAWSAPTLVDKSVFSTAPGGLNRQRPDVPQLAACLDLIQEECLLPPASHSELTELDLALNCKLPLVIAELYKHHGGFISDLHSLPLRLMSPKEVMETLKEFNKSRLGEEDRIWNDGHSTCLFWTSNNAVEAAGIFLDGPLTGKVYLREYESMAPMPDFRGLTTFYQWLIADLNDNDDNSEAAEIPKPDYPSLSPRTDDQADQELSEKLLKQWEDDGRRNELQGAYGVRLSAYKDTDKLVQILLSIVTQPQYYGIVRDIVDIVVKRNYIEAARILYEAALLPETRAAATKALMELLELPEARQARNKLREIFG